MPYRFNAYAAPRRLALNNHSWLRAVAAASGGVSIALIGCAVLPVLNLIVPPFGADVAVSAVATVLILAGGSLVASAVRMRRSRTVLAVERGVVTVTVLAGMDAVTHHVLRIDQISHVGMDSHEGRHCAQIMVHGGAAVPIGDSMTSFLAHHERHAAAVRRFLCRA